MQVQVEVEIEQGVEQGADEGDEQVEEGGSSLNKKGPGEDGAGKRQERNERRP